MSNVKTIDFVALKKSKPAADTHDIVELILYQDSFQMELVCISCVYRWDTILPETMPTKLLECPACGDVGTIICQP